MKRLVISVIAAIALALVPVSGVLAAEEDTVTVTAKPGYISISNAPNSYDFGSVTIGSTPNTTTGYFTITNGSGITTDITIGCNGWSPTTGSNSWTYGAAGADTAQLKASGTNGGTGGSGGAGLYDLTVPSSGSVTLCDDLSSGTNPGWELQLDAPTSFSHGDEQQTTVTLTATAA